MVLFATAAIQKTVQSYNVPKILLMTSQSDSHVNCLPQSLIQYQSEETKCAYNSH
jgi:hypothetical protein